jgi:glyoxylase-like metal-dependent hydrolase (beta-lactamase superfamily II)
MEVLTINKNDFQENTYIVANKKETVIIDPGTDYSILKGIIEEKGLGVKYFLLTHGHYDHIMALTELAAFELKKVYAHRAEQKLLENAPYNLSAWTSNNISIKGINYYDGETHVMDGMEFYHVPGHTEGGVLIKIGDNLFSGDTLFYDTVGRTDLPTGDSRKLRESLKKFDGLDKKLMVYPGHGEAFILGDAYKTNFFLKKK